MEIDPGSPEYELLPALGLPIVPDLEYSLQVYSNPNLSGPEHGGSPGVPYLT